MTTTGSAFVAPGSNSIIARRRRQWPPTPACPRYVERSWWPSSLASQNPSTEELVTIMHKYAKRDTIDFDDHEVAEAWTLWAKAPSAAAPTSR
jgi:hypothetical protein